MNLEKKYYAKLMLAGEYGVISGSEALTVPLKIFSAKLTSTTEKRSPGNEEITASVNSIRNLVTYINALPRNSFYATPDTEAIEGLLKKGYYIESDIPEGYGIGSSGAVSALIYDQFFSSGEKLSMQQQKRDLATLESCFHGKSSGVDAMTCYTGQALHFMPGDTIRQVETDSLDPGQGYRFFLVDSGAVFDTGPLVGHYLHQLNDPEFSKIIHEDYFPLISKFIQAVTGSPGTDPALIFRAISDLQWNHFRKMIPEQMEDAWINGQVSNAYYLKLNGSGGGFMLGIAHGDSTETVEQMLSDFKVIWM